MKPSWVKPSQGQLTLAAAVNAALDGAGDYSDPDRMGGTGEVAPLASYAGHLTALQLDKGNLRRCDKRPPVVQIYL